MADSASRPATNEGIQQYYHTKIDELQVCHLKRDSGCALIRIFPVGGGGEDSEREATGGTEK